MTRIVSESVSYYNPDLPSLAMALTRLEAMPDETPARIQRVRAAVASFVRLMNKPADEIPAHAPFLRQQFTRFKSNPMGLSEKSIANCKTEIRYLVKTTCEQAGRSALKPLTPEWATLRDRIPEQPSLWKVSKLMAYCSAAGISPDDVTDDTIADFLAALSAAGDIDKPERYLRTVVNVWNRLGDIMPDWPQHKLTLPPTKRRGWTIAPADFPASFRADVDLWEKRLTVVDPEAEDGPIRPLRPASVLAHRHHLFKAATALVMSGRAIETITGLKVLVDIDAFKTILRFLRERRGGEPSDAICGVGMTLKAVARHFFKTTDVKQLQQMARICANYKAQTTGGKSKNRERLERFEDERLMAALLHLPSRLLEEAGRPRTTKRDAVRLAQVAIAIEIELHAPLRLSNLVALNLGTNIQAVIVNGETRWIMRFEHSETKNRSNLNYELPAEAVKFVTKAMKLYDQKNGWLFPGRSKHKQPSALGNQISQEVERHLNVPFNTHVMRGLVATAQVKDNDGGGFEMARAMLGDRSDRVVREHYTKAAERTLIARAQATIQRARIRTAPLAPARTATRKAV